jgi:hypothetical protein
MASNNCVQIKDCFIKKHNLILVEITDVKNNRNLLKRYGYKKAGIYVDTRWKNVCRAQHKLI